MFHHRSHISATRHNQPAEISIQVDRHLRIIEVISMYDNPQLSDSFVEYATFYFLFIKQHFWKITILLLHDNSIAFLRFMVSYNNL